MCWVLISISDAKIEEIRSIRFNKQCPNCGHIITPVDDGEMHMYKVKCTSCGAKYQVPIEDYINIQSHTE